MLEIVTSGFKKAKNILKNERELTEKNINKALEQVRLSLLRADVEYNVIDLFLNKVKYESLGKNVLISSNIKNKKIKVSPSDHFIGICFDKLKSLMGPVDTSILISKPIASIMIVGLQGSGKTTITAKLGLFLKKKNYKSLLVSADVYRPAAAEQLRILAKSIELPVFHDSSLSPVEICKNSYKEARNKNCDVIIYDTAGRLEIDKKLMLELLDIKKAVNPDNIFFTIDSMTGRSAVKIAVKFDEELDLNGFILTKLDGDARGGAALSIKEVTKKPIKFLGLGERLMDLEEFRPDGIASRILGMGDVVGLINDFKEHVDQNQAKKDATRMLNGSFNLQDFLNQIKTIKKIGPLQNLADKIPGFNSMIKSKEQLNNFEFIKFESIILSMTKRERSNPQILKKERSRLKRIAIGSGRCEKNILELLKRFEMMQKMMNFSKSKFGLLSKISALKNLGKIGNSNEEYVKDLSGDFFSNFNMNNDNIKNNKKINIDSRVMVKFKKDKKKQAKKSRKKNKKKK